MRRGRCFTTATILTAFYVNPGQPVHNMMSIKATYYAVSGLFNAITAIDQFATGVPVVLCDPEPPPIWSSMATGGDHPSADTS